MSGIAAAGAAAAPILGGIIGSIADDDAENQAKDARQKALEIMAGVRVPSIEEQKILLKELKLQGELTPEMEAAITLGPSRMETISIDPRLKQAQLQALSSLGQLGEGGLNLQDRAALMDITRQASQEAKARDASILQNLAARGMGGSGSELVARLQASQDAANRSSEQGMNLASQAQQRALQAIAQGGGLAGSMAGQEFGQQAQVAQAGDVISQFNVGNRQNVGQRNVQSSNLAQQANLSEKQRIADQNVALANQQEMYNKSLYQRQFENQLAKAGGLANQYGNQANAAMQDAANTRGMWSGIGSGVGQGAASYAQMGQQQRQWDAGNDLRSAQTDYYRSLSGYQQPTVGDSQIPAPTYSSNPYGPITNPGSSSRRHLRTGGWQDQ